MIVAINRLDFDSLDLKLIQFFIDFLLFGSNAGVYICFIF